MNEPGDFKLPEDFDGIEEVLYLEETGIGVWRCGVVKDWGGFIRLMDRYKASKAIEVVHFSVWEALILVALVVLAFKVFLHYLKAKE